MRDFTDERLCHVLARTIVNLALCEQLRMGAEGRPAPSAMQYVRSYVKSLRDDLNESTALNEREAQALVAEALSLI